MEANTPATSPAKPSGLRRAGVSRLPVLRNRASQIFVRKQDPPQPVVGVANGTFKSPPEAGTSRPSSNQSGVPAKQLVATAKPCRARGTTSTKTSTQPEPSNDVRPTVRTEPLSYTSYPAQHTRSSKRIVDAQDNSEIHDELGSLESFRPASRQDNRDPSPQREKFVEPVKEDSKARPRKPSRPSLSDRTIDSLNQLPATPGSVRRRSSFFAPPESPMGPPSRPASAIGRWNSNGSRPGTSDGTFGMPLARPPSPAKKAPASVKPASRMSMSGFGFTPRNGDRRSVSAAFTSKLQAPSTEVPPLPRLPTPLDSQHPFALPNGRLSQRPVKGSKTLAAKPTKSRPGLGGVFAKPNAERSPSTEPAEEQTQPTSAATQSKNAVLTPVNSSSAALRQQIAAAKAAKRAAMTKHDSPQDANASTDAFPFDLDSDPFNQVPKDGRHMLRNRINSARTNGKLNVAAMGLKRIPAEVLKMYDAESMEESKVNWAEVVDVTRLIAADNELEEVGDEVFPDVDPAAAAEEESPNIFGGLEMLDFHGNQLKALPTGFRRLQRLTSLNLAHNKLSNGALDVIAQIISLKELRLGHNCISSNLPIAICQLPHLETLDLQSNRLQSLPESIRELAALKVLNVSGNQLSSLPLEALQSLPLLELDASSNVLMGSLWPMGPAPGAHATLRVLNLANNSLAALTFSESLDLPCMTSLDITNNHFAMLPDMSAWTNLVTLAAGDNKIPELPKGFTSLKKLRNANFTGNELRTLDPEIARMEGLESLILASNPLREKKFLSMSAADIKQDLEARLEPEEHEETDLHDNNETSGRPLSNAGAPSAKWMLMANGMLDLASRDLSDNLNDMLGSFLKANDVRQLLLQRNKLTAVPPALWLGQDLRVLDLSSNTLALDYLSDDLSLPSLQELNVANTRLTTLEPLITQLEAPSLRHLDICTNRLTGPLPVLRKSYPALTTLLASNNKFMSISVDALRGLHTVNLSSNDIAQLPSEIGLLWKEGLKILEIGSNAFRVPSYRVLEKGTEAVLRWLRDRIPTGNNANSSHINGEVD